MTREQELNLALSGGLYLLTILACGGSAGPSRSSAVPVAGPAITISAPELVDAYQANELAADQRFKDRPLVVAGVVDSISKDTLGSPYVTLKGPSEGFRSVQAMLPRDMESRLAQLRKGQALTVRCHGKG